MKRTGAMALSLGRALSLIPYPASCTTSHLNKKILRGFKT